jgi:hypothetical protein
MHRVPLLLSILAGACAGGPPPERAFALEVEGGAAWQTRNDVAVPGDTGTRFPLDDLTGSGPFAAARAYLTWRPAARHELRALAAPFSVSGSGSLEAPVDFAGASFAAGVPTRANYRFDSYRLTWRYEIHPGETFRWWIGGTLKVRDAEIELQQGATSARKTDTGLVPLLHFAGDWLFAEDWRLALDVDGAAAPQGRAIDASLKACVALSDELELGLGYRTVEGGADNDEVYTFAWLHQAVVSLRYDF